MLQFVRGSTSHKAMPSKNVIKEFTRDQYYHLYNRGVEKRDIFVDDSDYVVFLGLFKKYLTGENSQNKNRHGFESLQGQVDLIAYCLMPNHFHLLLYPHTEDAVTNLMRRVFTGYVMYFNNKYNRVGGLFQGVYKASQINEDAYLDHITRYIHLNPEDYKTWPYSSYPYYIGKRSAEWINPRPVLDMFGGETKKYEEFVADYVDAKHELDTLKYQLANQQDL